MDIPKLRVSLERLNSYTDKIGENVRAIEELLTKSQLGFYVSVRVNEEMIVDRRGDPIGQASRSLAYNKVAGRWRIVIEDWNDIVDPDEGLTTRPWSDCPRSEKLETIGKLSELLDRLGEEIEKKASLAESAIGTTKSVLQSLCETLPAPTNPFGIDQPHDSAGVE